ncbi:hypothetical protein K1T71_008300 [Dendrolimus kikuchii]|uniref:Uncharacterized protein n=1 Tax=Dendrolimus kikuchii TaxID=765133 RepID=A0ACC1CX03_9NEOP|nr:hypothetical protein K1T71_008300 [Dendrolimus kikuchii]
MATSTIKITDLIKRGGQITYSFEITSDITVDELNNVSIEPAFYSVTWHAKSHQCKNLDIAPIKTATLLKNLGKNVLMHISCDMMKKDYLDELLILLKEKSICNLFVVLGENFDSNSSDFQSTLEMIKYIKGKTGDYFAAGIAGFPDSTDEKIQQIKEKIDGGADFILTQAFFDSNIFKTYVERCKKFGIEVPIVPGVFPFETYKQLNNFINMCKVKVSEDLLEKAKSCQDQDESCVGIIRTLIGDLTNNLNVKHIHLFTLNKLKNNCELIKSLQ